jgi:dienelactone hydrolase
MASIIRGASFVVRAANLQGRLRRLADRGSAAVAERPVEIPVDGGPLRARVFAPETRSRSTVLLVSGLNPSGIDDPRLIAFARELARSQLTVVTPDIPELRRFEITPRLTERIEQSATAVADSRELAPGGRIGLMGISFSGGLSMVAAGRPPLRDRVRSVFSLGGHDDLPRVLHYLCTGTIAEHDPAGPAPDRPHEYGIAVVLLNVADHLVPANQVAPLRAAVRRFLAASSLESTDPDTAAREFAALHGVAAALPTASRALFDAVRRCDLAALGPLLLPHVPTYVEPAALSPARSQPPSAPVFLLHGARDTIVPAAESARQAARLRGQVPLRLLITDLISHADRSRRPGVGEVLRLARFWGDLLER